VARKLDAISGVLGVLRDRGYGFVRLDDAVEKAVAPG
jgi:hypothetical protein